MKHFATNLPMQKLRQPLVIALLGAALFFLSGCSVYHDIKSIFTGDSDPVQASPETLAMDALEEFNHGQYSDALKLFNEIEERFPFSRFSLMAELKSADCHYYLGHYTEAISAYEDFAKNHPTNEAMPYVLFQVGMCHFNQMDTIDRDPGSAIEAEIAFNKLVRLYPASPYTEEAKGKISATRNFLAEHELYVARFYIKMDKLEQSMARLQYLLDNYPDTSVAPEAAMLLTGLQAGEKPKGKWRDWIPEIGLPDWTMFKDFGKVTPQAPAKE
ncbi:MAG: outer membrane protein assembly factor BamD [Deltaproteobacteria bacterium]|nr:outer membrane protein assembly factor BamD [Deltaproteobacteria bacterium]